MENGSGSQPHRIVFIVLLLFAVFTFQLVYHAVRTSATVDEPDHILAGYRTGNAVTSESTLNILRPDPSPRH